MFGGFAIVVLTGVKKSSDGPNFVVLAIIMVGGLVLIVIVALIIQ